MDTWWVDLIGWVVLLIGTVEVLPLGVRCQLSCTYCYQDPVREREAAASYDLDRIKATLLEAGQRFTLFGGEPLLLPIDDFRELCRWGAEHLGPCSLQTNGALLSDEHLRIIQRYGVSVGVSIDGPGPLNDARWAGTLEATRTQTARSEHALRRLLAAGVKTSLIVTLHRRNAEADRLPLLEAWLRDLIAAGLRWLNLHLLEVDRPAAADLLLDDEAMIAALRRLKALDEETACRVQPWQAMRALLRGHDATVMCVWHGCDPYTTEGVYGIDGQGDLTNCLRTAKEGVSWRKADRVGYERYLALVQTPQAYGGCAGCRFFLMCKGQCPGEAEQGDWRGRTRWCRVLMTLYADLEAELVAQGQVPLSLAPDLSAMVTRLCDGWRQGVRHPLGSIRSGESGTPPADRPLTDQPHIDHPHLDHEDAVQPIVTHDDHDDAAAG